MTSPFVVYDQSGQILRTGSCPESMINLQAGKSEYVLEGDGTDRNHKVVGGRIVQKSETELQQIIDDELIAQNKLKRRAIIEDRKQQILEKMALKELENEGIL